VPRNRLIILGASVTALAVVRNAVVNRLEPVLLDTRDGIAFRSSLAQSVFCYGNSDNEVLQTLLDLARTGVCSLIATSDRWIDFLMLNRSSLEQAYDTVLQASNDVLAICTDKLLFAHWCDENNVAAPRLYRFDGQDLPPDSELNYPLLLRPYKGVMNVGAGGVPKAAEAADRTSLQQWLKIFGDAGVQPIITQSLLGLGLTQYSVGLARNHERMVSFVAEKLRPVADQCAVGSYVVLRDNPAVEKLARDVAERLDYFGIAEFEILHAEETGDYYLIEINARPWIQYGLGPESGHDFLQVLLDGDSYDSKQERKTGTYWIDFSDDLFNCFSSNTGLVRSGKITVMTYLKSLLCANVFAKWRFRDQKPFWLGLRQLVNSAIFRRST